MELIVEAVIDNELNQDICVKYWIDKESGEEHCGWFS